MGIRKKTRLFNRTAFFKGKCQELRETELELVVLALDGWAGLCLWAGENLHLCCPKPGLVGAEPACSLPTSVLMMSFRRPAVGSPICVVTGINGVF